MTRTETREMVWLSVETPSVFREVHLPVDPEQMTAAEARKLERLEHLAEQHGTYVRSSTYRRG